MDSKATYSSDRGKLLVKTILRLQMKDRARTVAHFTKVKVFTAAFYAVKNGKAKLFYTIVCWLLPS